MQLFEKIKNILVKQYCFNKLLCFWKKNAKWTIFLDFFEKGFRIDTEGFIGAIPGLFIFCDFRKVPSTDDLKSIWNVKITMVTNKMTRLQMFEILGGGCLDFSIWSTPF